MQYTSELFRPDANSTFSADTSTQVLVFDPLAGDECRASVGVDVVYRDPQGIQRRARAFGTDVVDLQIDEVQGNSGPPTWSSSSTAPRTATPRS